MIVLLELDLHEVRSRHRDNESVAVHTDIPNRNMSIMATLEHNIGHMSRLPLSPYELEFGRKCSGFADN